MNSERWERVAQLYQEALERDRSQRDAFVQGACSDDRDSAASTAPVVRVGNAIDE